MVLRAPNVMRMANVLANLISLVTSVTKVSLDTMISPTPNLVNATLKAQLTKIVMKQMANVLALNM